MKEFILMVVLLSGPVLANEQDNKAYAEEGEKAAIAVLKELRSRLTEKMAVDLVGSVEYCHEKAIPLTQASSSKSPQVIEVRRTSLRVRNPANKPDAREIAMLKEWQKLEAAGKPLPSFALEPVSENEIRYYRPLKIETMCLTCHGAPSGELAKTIRTKYPQDKATGYKEGELRGLIRVTLKPQKIATPNGL